MLRNGLFAALVLVVGACGGGGGGVGGTDTPGVGWTSLGAKPEQGVYLEYLRGGVPTDPMNLNVGDFVTLAMANYDVAGKRTLLPGATFTLTGGAGKVSLSGANLTVLAPLTAKFAVNGQIGAGAGAVRAGQDGRVTSGTAGVSGRVLASDLVTPVAYLQVELYNSTGGLVGAGLTDKNGRFYAATSSTAKFLGVDPDTVTAGYFRMAKYQGRIYSTTGTACTVAIPAFGAFDRMTLPADMQLVRLVDGPPPPPDSCGK